MVDGFVKCAAAGIKVQVADPVFNAKQIVDKAKECADRGAKVIVFGELSVSAGTCGDLFFQPKLITACEEAVKEIAAFTKDLDAILFVGVPFKNRGRLYNVAVPFRAERFLVSFRRHIFLQTVTYGMPDTLRRVIPWLSRCPMQGR